MQGDFPDHAVTLDLDKGEWERDKMRKNWKKRGKFWEFYNLCGAEAKKIWICPSKLISNTSMEFAHV